MAFSDDEDGEAQLLLSNESRAAIERSKRTMAETREISAEVLRSLSEDSEKIRGVKRKQERVSLYLDDAERTAKTIERNELIQFAFVCAVLFLVVLGLFVVLIRIVLKKSSF